MTTFTCKEWLGRDWPSTLVTYPFESSTYKNISVGDVPFQLSENKSKISFYAELKANETYQYNVSRERFAKVFETSLKLSQDDTFVTIENDHTGIRLPATQIFDTPKSIDQVKSPFQGMRLFNGDWSGSSHFSTNVSPKPMVAKITTSVLEQGPLFIDVEVSYEFVDGEYYKFKVRVLDGDPAMRIIEESDFKRVDGPEIKIVFKISENKSMDKIFWFTNKNRLVQRDVNFENVLKSWGVDTQPGYKNIGHRNMDFAKNLSFANVNPWSPWGSTIHYFGMVSSADQNVFAAFVPMHAGEWRGYTRDAIVSQWADGSAGFINIYTPVEHPKNLTFSGEFDANVNESYVRKEWALFGGPFLYHQDLKQFRQYEGYINLNDYKDWKLEWQEDKSLKYPRLMFSKDDLETIDDNHPYKKEIDQMQFVNDTASNLDKLFKKGQNAKWFANSNLDMGGDDKDIIWTSHYRQAERCSFVHWHEEILASQHLPEEKRIEIRAHLAACCYILSNRDFNPRGSMIHLGTPNMATNRFLALAFPMMLIPDHPRFSEWANKVTEYLEYKAASNISPEGTWAELITYFDAGASFLLMAGYMMHRAGMISDKLAELLVLPYKFLMEMIAPGDPRISNIRTAPGWGHEGAGVCTPHTLLAAVMMKDINPTLSKNLMWLWNIQKRPLVSINDVYTSKRAIVFSEMDSEPPNLESKHFPGFGTVLRSHHGDEKELFLSYRQGYHVSHNDINQGDFVLYGHGKPLSVMSCFGYIIHSGDPSNLNNTFGWHNRVRFGSMADTVAWPGGGTFSAVHNNHFGETVDYLLGQGNYTQGSWIRQVMMVKSREVDGPNYIIMRDSLIKKNEDPVPRWWYLRTLGNSTKITPTSNGFKYDSMDDVKLDVQIVSHSSVEVEIREVTSSKSLNLSFKDVWTHDVDGKGSPQETMSVTAIKSDDVDFVTILAPLNKDQWSPFCQKLGEGVYRVVTNESVDYIFVSNGDEELFYENEQVSFKGIAGIIRCYEDKVYYEFLQTSNNQKSSIDTISRMSFEGITVESTVPTTRVVLRSGANKSVKTFRKIANYVDSVEIVPGIVKHETDVRVFYDMFNEYGINYKDDTLQFNGRDGSITYFPKYGLTRLSVRDGWVIAYKDVKAWTYSNNLRFDVSYYESIKEVRVTYTGSGYMWMTWPEGFGNMPLLYLDNVYEVPYATGTSKWFIHFALPVGHSCVVLRPRLDPTPFDKP